MPRPPKRFRLWEESHNLYCRAGSMHPTDMDTVIHNYTKIDRPDMIDFIRKAEKLIALCETLVKDFEDPALCSIGYNCGEETAWFDEDETDEYRTLAAKIKETLNG